MCLLKEFPVALFLFSAPLAFAQATVSISGGDAGEGLDLSPTQVIAAYNLNGSAFTVQGVEFTGLSAGFNHPTYSTTDADPFDAIQTSADDIALRGILQTMAWDGFGGGSPILVNFTGLSPDTSYRLDVLYFGGSFQSREQAIVVNGTLIDIVTLSTTVALDTYFTVNSDAGGNIALSLVGSGPYGGIGVQDGAIVNAVVLSSVIPEPASAALLLGLAGLGAVFGRRGARRIQSA